MVAAALFLVGIVLFYNGTVDLPDIPERDQAVILVACLLGGALTWTLVALIALGRIAGSGPLEASMLAGLVTAATANAATGWVWPESLWIICGYTMVIIISGGVTLRNGWVFGIFTVATAATWFVISGRQEAELEFRSDATTLVFVGCAIAVAMFITFRVERGAQTELNHILKRQADSDALTGALNRNGFVASFTTLGARSAAEGEAVWCAYIDVDYFKAINDRYGHDRGDEVLREVVSALRVIVGERGLVARWGGDEFVIAAIGAAPVETDIEADINRRIEHLEVGAKVSAGIADLDVGGGGGSESVIEKADRKMYRRRDHRRSNHPGQAGTPSETLPEDAAPRGERR